MRARKGKEAKGKEAIGALLGGGRRVSGPAPWSADQPATTDPEAEVDGAASRRPVHPAPDLAEQADAELTRILHGDIGEVHAARIGDPATRGSGAGEPRPCAIRREHVGAGAVGAMRRGCQAAR